MVTTQTKFNRGLHAGITQDRDLSRGRWANPWAPFRIEFIRGGGGLSLDTRIFRKSRSNAVHNFPLGFRILRMDHPSIGFLRIATPFPSNDRRMDGWIAIRGLRRLYILAIRFISFLEKYIFPRMIISISLFLCSKLR